jgi:hypothetical protein
MEPKLKDARQKKPQNKEENLESLVLHQKLYIISSDESVGNVSSIAKPKSSPKKVEFALQKK